jgi:Tfp pilus assembly protein PilF
LRDYDTALYAFNRAVAIRPNYSKAWEKMGDLFLLMDEHDSANQAFRLARED